MRSLIAFILVLMLLPSCTAQPSEPAASQWGSFTDGVTYSYDEKYYAVQDVILEDDIRWVRVCIYNASDDTLVDSFVPARAWDFWGICWEKNTYNIWTQSADIGIYCYAYEGGKWTLDEYAVQPKYIISKWE